MIQINSYLENLFLTQTEAHLHQGSLRSPLVQFRYSRGSNQRRTLRDSTNLPERSGPSPAFGLTPLALRTSLLPPVCALSLIRAQPELSYSASWSYHQIWPTKCQACVQHDMRTYSESVLNRHILGQIGTQDLHAVLLLYHNPARSPLFIDTWLFPLQQIQPTMHWYLPISHR